MKPPRDSGMAWKLLAFGAQASTSTTLVPGLSHGLRSMVSKAGCAGTKRPGP